jgi:hypothetical protein
MAATSRPAVSPPTSTLSPVEQAVRANRTEATMPTAMRTAALIIIITPDSSPPAYYPGFAAVKTRGC